MVTLTDHVRRLRDREKNTRHGKIRALVTQTFILILTASQIVTATDLFKEKRTSADGDAGLDF
jgi:transcriptional regulator of met regulon